MVAVTVVASDGIDATESSDIIIDVDWGEGSIDIGLDSGRNRSTILHVTNLSSSYLNLDVYDQIGNAMNVSNETTIGSSSGASVIYPAGDSDGRHIAIVTLTITTKRLANTQSWEGWIQLRFTDLDMSHGDSTTISTSTFW